MIVYRVEHDPDDATAIDMRAWEADELTGRLDRSRYVGKAKLTGYEGPAIRGQWVDSTDTDRIHELPEEVRDALWEFDDAARAAMR
ncbi:MAG: hypothetical protein JSS74_08860 [Actinobacteria bacterium]|nr:hypothetical protein [Actinomycetota bacterium]